MTRLHIPLAWTGLTSCHHAAATAAATCLPSSHFESLCTGALAAAAGSPTPDWKAKVKWLEAQGCKPNSRAVDAAAAVSSASTDTAGASGAADNGADARLRWLIKRGYPLFESSVAAAAAAGSMEALQLLLQNMDVPPPPARSTVATTAAAMGGHLAALQGLHLAGWPMRPRQVGFIAAANGRLDMLSWLVDTVGADEAALDSFLFTAAVGSPTGSLELLAWLRQCGCDWSAEAWTAAAGAGWAEALEWLAAQGCPMPENGEPYIAAVCTNGDLATASCLRRLGVPWGPAGTVARAAIFGGSGPLLSALPLLRWLLLEAGCPVGPKTAEWRRWLEQWVQAGRPGAAEAERLLEEAAPAQMQARVFPAAQVRPMHARAPLEAQAQTEEGQVEEEQVGARIEEEQVWEQVVGRARAWAGMEAQARAPVRVNVWAQMEEQEQVWAQMQKMVQAQAQPKPSPNPAFQLHTVYSVSGVSGLARVFPQLPPEAIARVVCKLDRNEVAATIRLVNKATATQFSGSDNTTIRMSQPVPHHAFLAHWGPAGAMRAMTLKQRRQLLCLTAASGMVPNLEVAVQAAGCLPKVEVFEAAASAAQLASCKWLLEHGCTTHGLSFQDH
ncbi:hypothetical protein GPECTOR_11g63 [Gonium pectorale]|uniref:F-box domain-containing protein n=1 Tax=Gonium pectorale TaxID=33097 RepID=A0A150GQB7_GONPE|nr:hypothetical protein GPECTOR_11g63 [Gonium pectorale]|eukprot:KXZ51938.1 hypothetical protein GPECTOR_11g63 [Gonium pectorale]